MKCSLLAIIKSIEPKFGEITTSRMFGGTGIFFENVMFAIIDRGRLHIRASERQCRVFESQKALRFQCRNYSASISSSYYSLGEEIIADQQMLLEYFQESHQAAVEYHKKKQQFENEKLKFRPNLTGSTERLLERAGIHTVSELVNIGAAGAYHAIQQVKEDVGIKLMWNLEGAIQGVYWSVVTYARRDELLIEYQNLLEDKQDMLAA